MFSVVGFTMTLWVFAAVTTILFAWELMLRPRTVAEVRAV